MHSDRRMVRKRKGGIQFKSIDDPERKQPLVTSAGPPEKERRGSEPELDRRQTSRQAFGPSSRLDVPSTPRPLAGAQLRDTCPPGRGRVWGARRILPEVAGLQRVMLGFAGGVARSPVEDP